MNIEKILRDAKAYLDGIYAPHGDFTEVLARAFIELEKRCELLEAEKDAKQDMKNWKDLGTAWLDELTGIAWDKEFKTSINHYEAEKWAKKQGKRLPTQDEFKIAEQHKIRELSDMGWQCKWFWSSTLYPDSPGFAYGFDGYYGNADDNYNRDDSYSGLAARCVSSVMDM